MEPGTYAFRMNLAVGKALKVNIPVDVVIQPKRLRKDRLPILIEAKSAGDFTNTNKRRRGFGGIQLNPGRYPERDNEMTPSEATNEHTRREWRELGFYYDSDDKGKEWRLVGSRAGLSKFKDVLLAYVSDPRNMQTSEHDHYGPYMYLEVMTWPEAGIDGHSIHGTFDDLRGLADLIGWHLALARPGDSFVIGPEYSAGAEYSIHFEVMEDGFDPATADAALDERTG